MFAGISGLQSRKGVTVDTFKFFFAKDVVQENVNENNHYAHHFKNSGGKFFSQAFEGK
jgi:hypothetical protein